MKKILSKSLFTYVIGLFLVMAIAGGILSLITTNYIVLISVLFITYVILTLMLLYAFDKYINPIHKSIKTVNHLVAGNYRARIHHPSNGSIGELSTKINALARNLSEYSIHEQLQAEQLSTVINNTESGLVLVDEKGYIHLVNRKFISMFGKTSKDYVGYLYYDVMENSRIHKTVQETFLYEKNVKKSFTQEGIDPCFFEIVGAPIFNDRKILKGAVLVFYDITELKLIELMRKDFVANISHELKNPIHTINQSAEQLLEEISKDGLDKNNLSKVIYEETSRLKLLIEDLIILTNLEKESSTLKMSMVNVYELVEEVILELKKQATGSSVLIKTNVDQDLVIKADHAKLEQIIKNLLVNAISYTSEHGEVNLVVEVSADDIHILVKDTGIGINQEELPRIFERFYRVDKERNRDTGGTGLGLAIVKHIVEVYDGHIEVESELNVGSVFTVLLPKINA